jgi:hypothetical protein
MSWQHPYRTSPNCPLIRGINAEAIIDQSWVASDEILGTDTPLAHRPGVAAVIDCLEYQIVLMVEAS